MYTGTKFYYFCACLFTLPLKKTTNNALDPGSLLNIFLQDTVSILNPAFSLNVGIIAEILILIGLFFVSGFISGAETAFFAITPAQFFQLKETTSGRSRLVYALLEKPKRLLATLLISINFVNIAIVVLSSLIFEAVFEFRDHQVIGFLIQVVSVTFVIVLFCEVMPKVYATQNALRSALKSVLVIFALDKVLRPFSSLLVYSTSFVEQRFGHKGYDVSVDELTHAIDITSDKSTPEEEKKILKGIARFGNTDVRQIMKPRMDVIAFDKELKFTDLIASVNEHRYSRLPVYEGSFDHVIGVLYIKDVIPFLDKKDDADFAWIKLMREAYFVPESKKINDLLQEFQEKKIHLAVVIDEYGGSSGLVTLEDILEEIVGEINDEFDEEEMEYSKLDNRNFVFEGKTNLNDISRVMEVDRSFLNEGNESIDTLAGLILEIKGSIPQRNETIKHHDIIYTIESADKKRIKRVKITLPESLSQNNTNNTSGSNSGSLLMLLMIGFLFFTGCKQDPIPKERGYFRIELPTKRYTRYISPNCPYEFDMPTYAVAVPDTAQNAEPCWINIEFPQFKGTLYLSYKNVNGDLQKYIDDSRALSMKHITKASGMNEETIIRPDKKVYGTYYSVKGNTASSVQFFLTDSTKHFMRGALYFYAVPNPDSLSPVLQFVEKDVRAIVETWEWK